MWRIIYDAFSMAKLSGAVAYRAFAPFASGMPALAVGAFVFLSVIIRVGGYTVAPACLAYSSAVARGAVAANFLSRNRG